MWCSHFWKIGRNSKDLRGKRFLFLIHLASLDVDRLSERSMDISVLRNLYRRCNLGREFCISRNNIIFIVFNEFINNVKDFINLRNKVSL